MNKPATVSTFNRRSQLSDQVAPAGPDRQQAIAKKSNITDDLMIRLSTACGVVAEITGERPHPATLHRWERAGLKGIKLRTAFAGGHKRTCRTWILEFFAKINAAESREPVATPGVPTARQSQIEKAKQELAGI